MMNKKSVIKELEKARENLLDAEQLKAINYAIKIFKALSDKVCIDSSEVLEIIDKLIKEYEREGK